MRDVMSHLIGFLGEGRPRTDAVAAELRRVVTSWTESIGRHLTAPSLVTSPLRLKRAPVQLTPHEGEWFVTPRSSERLGELLNVLATVVRTADALEYLAQAAEGGVVVACNPTTSDAGHDVEVVDADGRHSVVEVSDVAGRGNANGKMTKDLTTLLGASPTAELMMAVSPSSAAWLTNARTTTTARLGVRCRPLATIGDAADVATHVISVERTSTVTGRMDTDE